MLVLAIDSSAGTSAALLHAADRGSAALAQTLAVACDRDPRSHAEVVGTLLRTVLAAGQASPAEVDAVAVGVGPGPFTGLRVGIAAGVAFALGASARVLGVPSHDAVAAAALAEGAALPLRVVRDARRHEWFLTAYAGTDAAGMPQAAPTTVVPRDAVDPGDLGVCCAAPEADWIGRVALARLAAAIPARGTEPIYVRSPDVSAATHKSVLQ